VGVGPLEDGAGGGDDANSHTWLQAGREQAVGHHGTSRCDEHREGRQEPGSREFGAGHGTALGGYRRATRQADRDRVSWRKEGAQGVFCAAVDERP
jgi:hypothetical protein